jgi:hypothetical protein
MKMKHTLSAHEFPKEVLDFFRSCGTRGGKARAKNLTAEVRSAGARNASMARWKKSETVPRGGK